MSSLSLRIPVTAGVLSTPSRMTTWDGSIFGRRAKLPILRISLYCWNFSTALRMPASDTPARLAWRTNSWAMALVMGLEAIMASVMAGTLTSFSPLKFLIA